MSGVESEAPVNVAPAMEDPIEEPTFDLSKKKKKKKKPTVDTGETNGVEAVTDGVSAVTLENKGEQTTAPPKQVDFSLPDFTGKKKKKKKKVVFDDDYDAETGEVADGGSAADASSRREIAPQPWDGTERDYTYHELVTRAFNFLHGKSSSRVSESSTVKKISVPLPQVAREGTKKTVYLNFGASCKSMHRQPEHFLAYLSAEMGTTGNIQDGGRLVMKGRFVPEGYVRVLKKYMREYVICRSCSSPNTVLMRDANTRLYFVSCESCGAKRSVAPIKQGFLARVEKRKKM